MPENKSLEEMLINKGTTYSLRKGSFRSLLNQNKVIIIPYPLKKSVIGRDNVNRPYITFLIYKQEH